MQPSLRRVLVDSHIAAITVALLISTAISETFFALLLALDGLFRNLAAINFPLLRDTAGASAFLVANVSTNLAGLVAIFLAAWLLSRWAYGTGPLKMLESYRDRIPRRPNG